MMKPGRIILSGLAAILILGALAGCGPGSYTRYSVWDYEGRTDHAAALGGVSPGWSATAPVTGNTPASSMTMGSYYNSDPGSLPQFPLALQFQPHGL